MFSKRNFGLTDSIIETSKKVSEDYQEKVKGLMAKMGIKSLKDLSPEEKKKFFNKLDTMHKAKHEEVELDEAKSNFRGKKYAYDSDKHFGGKGTPEQRVQLLKLSNKALKAVPNSPAQKKIQKEIQALRKEMGMSFKEEVEQVDELKVRTLRSYKDKAMDDYEDKVDPRKGRKLTSPEAKKRMQGIHRASDKIQTAKIKQRQRMGVNEISKDLAKSYAKKSMKDIAKKQHSTGTVNTSKRFAGLDRAKKRIVKDDLDLEKMAGELDGASKMHKGQSDRIKKHLNKMDSGKTKSERTLTPGEENKKEKIVMSLKDKAADFEKRYPGKGKQVMYAVATKMAKKD